MAIASERVVGDLISANEFMDLSQQYAVSSVPKIVVNDRVEFIGALPEAHFLQAVLQAVSPEESSEEAVAEEDESGGDESGRPEK